VHDVACHILHAGDRTMDGLRCCESLHKLHRPLSAPRVARTSGVSSAAVITDRSGGLNSAKELRPFRLEASDAESQAA